MLIVAKRHNMTFKWRSKKVNRQMRCDLEQTRGDRYVGFFTGPRMVDADSRRILQGASACLY